MGGPDPGPFAWPRVEDDRNVQGAAAGAVPGVVAGMGLAPERFGSMPWRERVSPAAALAQAGMLLDWYSGLLIASTARALAPDADAAALFPRAAPWPPPGASTAAPAAHARPRRPA